jgi:hypothetical protein
LNQSSIDRAKRYPKETPWVKLITRSIELSLLSNPDWSLNSDLIKQYLSHGTLVLDCSTDPFNGHERTVKEQLLSVTEDFRILTGDVRYVNDPDSHIIFYPTFYIEITEQSEHPISVITNSKRTWPVSCLNGRTRIHRVENFIKLRSKNYFSRILFNIHGNFDLQFEMMESDDGFCDDSILTEYQLVQRELSQTRKDNNDLGTMDQAYTDSYVNLVTETSVGNKQTFLSEKSFKPMCTGQLALWLANPGTVRYMRDLGFDMFDDIIDHGYDDVLDWHQRIDLIHSQIDRIMYMDLEKIFIDTQDRRLHNQKLLYSSNLHDKMLEQANKEI